MTSKPVRRCHYCGTREGPFTRDHIVPRARGGQDRAWNIVPACHACNHAKANQWPKCTCSTCTGAVEHHRKRFGLTEQNAGYRAPIVGIRARYRHL